MKLLKSGLEARKFVCDHWSTTRPTYTFTIGYGKAQSSWSERTREQVNGGSVGQVQCMKEGGSDRMSDTYTYCNFHCGGYDSVVCM